MPLQGLLKYLFALAFIAGGINHFLKPKLYLSIMPPYLPWHEPLVFVSGVLEILFGVLLIFPATQSLAAWGLILLLAAIFPANVHMALNAETYASIPAPLLWLRLPLQFALIAWAYAYT